MDKELGGAPRARAPRRKKSPAQPPPQEDAAGWSSPHQPPPAPRAAGGQVPSSQTPASGTMSIRCLLFKPSLPAMVS